MTFLRRGLLAARLGAALFVPLVLPACDGPVAPDGGSDPVDSGSDGGVSSCARDSECGDRSLYCADWRCRPGEPGTDARGCIDLGPPCDGGACDEERDRCGAPSWCTEGRAGCLSPGDCDGDGASAIECGGSDCDDDDGDRYPGNPEVCDAEGHDEDCDPTSFGDIDADGDSSVSSACCNGDVCGPDCDDGDPAVNPSRVETCDGIDNNCSGAADDATGLCPGGLCAAGSCSFEAWDRTFGGTDRDYGHAVALGASGDVFVAGQVSSGSVNFGGGPVSITETRFFLLHLLADGTYDWVYTAPVGVVTPFDIDIDSSGAAYVVGNGTNLQFVGSPREGAFIVKIASDGTLADSLIVDGRSFFLGGGDAFTSVDVDGSSVWVTGAIGGTFDIGGTMHTASAGRSGVLAELDASLTVTDVDFFDVTAAETGSEGVRITDAQPSGGGLILAGSLHRGTLTLGTRTLRNESAPASGRTTDAFVARLRADGSVEWATTLDSLVVGGQIGRVLSGELAIATTGEIAVGTSFTGDCQVGSTMHMSSSEAFFLRRTHRAGLAIVLEPDGTPRWSRSFPAMRYMMSGVHSDVAGVAIDSLGRVYFVGTLEGAADLGGGTTLGGNGFGGQRSGYLTRFTLAGAHSISAVYANQGASTTSVAIGPGDAVAITGYFGGTTTFVSAPRVASGGGDVFVLRLASR